MKSLKISIIIPVYNSQAYLKKCLDSIVNQTYPNLEIIIINDGSTDNSGEIIDDYAKSDKRIKAFHKSNGGIGSAYNLALKHVTGDYLTFVDSDDWAELNLYEELVSILFDVYADVVSCGKKYVDSKGEFIKYNLRADSVLKSNDEILMFHFETMKHPGLGRLWKRELFQNVTIFEQNIGIDEMLTPQLLAKCNRAVYTSKVLYNVFLRENSVSRITYNDKKINETIKVYQFLSEFASKQIPTFADYLRVKYLCVLYGLHSQHIRGQFYLGNKMAHFLGNEFKTSYLNLKRSKQFNSQHLLLKKQMYLLYKSPTLYTVFIQLVARIKQIKKTIRTLGK